MINIVCSTDNNFVMPCGIMLYSLCKNNRDTDINIYIIIDQSVTEDNKRKLENTTSTFANCTCNFCLIDGNFFNSFPKLGEDTPKDYITKATYYRIFLTKVLPENVEKCLYLDCDIIINSSLKPLWDIDINDVALAATPDCGEGLIEKYNRLRYPQSKGYFNAGVLFVNLCYWRKHDALNRMLLFIKEHRDWIRLHDQDVLNRVFYEEKKYLPIRYNLQDGYLREYANYEIRKYKEDIQEALQNPCIIHFTDFKPWWNSCENPMAHFFHEYKKETTWSDVPLINKKEKGRTLKAFKHAFGCLLRDFKIVPENNYEASPNKFKK